MYAQLLRDERFPVKLGPCYHGIRPGALIDLARGFGVIARVRVRTEVGEYPYRTRKGTCYPVGTFTTTLAAPDILALARDGEILRVYDVATYKLGAPFRDALQVLLNARSAALRDGARDFVALSKLVGNSLAGRLARREGGWIRRSKLDGVQKWGDYFLLSADTGGMARFRYIAGAAWEYHEDKLPRGPHTAAFAHLTAYGRQRMASLRRMLPSQSCVSQDTDGLYLLPAGIRALMYAGISEQSGPGTIRVTGSASSGIWHGPRHYKWGDTWVLAGMPYQTPPDAQGRVSYSTRTPLFQERADRAPTEVRYVRHTTKIPTDLERGRVQADGWVLPPRIIPGRTFEG
jgi:hypothetical protein